MELQFLGTGTSHGIPVLACTCPVCRSSDLRDQRMRSSFLIRSSGGTTLIIDTGPEFRLQGVRAGLNRIDGILLTHAHADHIHGLDDVRPLSCKKEIPVFGNEGTITEMKERFAYIFKETQIGGGKPRIRPTVAPPSFDMDDVRVTALPVKHGDLDILGWRIDQGGHGVAYITDVSLIPEETKALLGNLDLLVLGALRKRPHPTHFSFDQAAQVVAELKPQRAYVTHLCHDHSHREMEALFDTSKNLGPAWDGLIIHL
jgi:phosphoribosyl 1,2-cyclic phosphate phosphodiesterase